MLILHYKYKAKYMLSTILTITYIVDKSLVQLSRFLPLNSCSIAIFKI